MPTLQPLPPLLAALAISACAPAAPGPAPETPAVVAAAAPAPTLPPKIVSVGSPMPEPIASDRFHDNRDGQDYRVVEVAGRLWFAENLNYSVPGSWCYDDRPESCQRFGRLYQWDAAMTACPSGWALPSEEEWQTVDDRCDGSLAPLLQGGNSGFNILMAGERRTEGTYQDLGTNFYFWSSTTLEYRARLRWNLTDAGLQIATDVKTEAYSVRCIQSR